MSPSVVCYPQPGKAKSRLLCEAFAKGCGGRLEEAGVLRDGPAAFYGVVGLERLFAAVRRASQPYYYIDNAFFDEARQVYYRIGKNALQFGGPGAADFARFAALELEVQPWRRDGRHIVVAAQSEHFMRHVAGWSGGALAWQEHVLVTLKKHTDRPIVVRHWSSDKAERAQSLQQDLQGAWALVTHASAAANEALLAGVPVFVTGPCAALTMGLSQLEQIEMPRRPDGRREWAAMLAAQQWTVDEIRSGIAWSALNA